MEPIRYPYRWTLHEIILIGVGASLVFVSLPIILTTALFVSLAVYGLSTGTMFVPFDQNIALIFLAFCGLGLMGLLSGLLGLVALYAFALPQAASLTAETFTYGHCRHPRVLRLAEIVHLRGRTELLYRRVTWVVTITDSQGRQIRMPVGSGLYRNTYSNFDYQTILRDLLPRLPATAQVEPGVQHFVATGTLP